MIDARARLSDLIVSFALKSERNMVLSGDHGYALFDSIRKQRPEQFLNVGIMEQAMVGIAAGLARSGFRSIVYGLSAFVPMRVLEQIKLDVCYSKLPVLFLGDGAGLVYSTLGASHQCGEDVAALRPLPAMRIYAPSDAYELTACFEDALASNGPAYIRIGKSDRPMVHGGELSTTDPVVLRRGSKTALVAMGSMTSLALQLANDFDLAAISVPRVKPLGAEITRLTASFETLIVLEEHSRFGGLCSAISDVLCESGGPVPKIKSLSLEDKFVEKCGSWQYALSEHNLSDTQIRGRIQEFLA